MLNNTKLSFYLLFYKCRVFLSSVALPSVFIYIRTYLPLIKITIIFGTIFLFSSVWSQKQRSEDMVIKELDQKFFLKKIEEFENLKSREIFSAQDWSQIADELVKESPYSVGDAERMHKQIAHWINNSDNRDDLIINDVELNQYIQWMYLKSEEIDADISIDEVDPINITARWLREKVFSEESVFQDPSNRIENPTNLNEVEISLQILGKDIPRFQPVNVEQQIALYQAQKAMFENPEVYFGLRSALEGLDSWKIFKDSDETNRLGEMITRLFPEVSLEMGKSGIGFTFSTENWRQFLIGRENEMDGGFGVSRMEDMATTWVALMFECERIPNTCLINTMSDQNQAYIKQALLYAQENSNFPDIESTVDIKALYPDQATLVQVEQFVENDKKEKRKVVKEVSDFINLKFEEYIKSMQKQNKEAYTENIKRNFPHYNNKDSFLLRLDNEIQDFKAANKELEEKLNSSNISEEEKIRALDDIRANNESIGNLQRAKDIYQLEARTRQLSSWLGFGISIVRHLPESENFVKAGVAGQAALRAHTAVVSMMIEGALDPTKLTVVMDAVGVILNIVSGVPSTEQVIISHLVELRKGQIKIINHLKELKHDIKIVDKKLDAVIKMLELSHTQIINRINQLQDDLHQIENEILSAIEEVKSIAQKMAQENLTQYKDDADALVGVLETYEYANLPKIVLRCKNLKEEYERTKNIVVRIDYDSCLEWAENIRFQIDKELNSTYTKAMNRLNISPFVTRDNFNTLSLENMNSYLEKNVEDRAGLLDSIGFWLEDQLKDLLDPEDLQWKEYQTLMSYLEEKIYHPYHFDESFGSYVNLTTFLPPLRDYEFMADKLKMMYSNKHLYNMCSSAWYIDSVSKSARDNLQKAWLVYIKSLRAVNQEINQHLAEVLDGQVEQKTDIVTYIIREKYNIAELLNTSSKEIVQKAGQRAFITDSYLIAQGFYKTVQGDCLQVSKAGENSSSKKVPYNEADLNIEKQKEHFEQTVKILQSNKKCWITDIDGSIKGLNKGSRFQVEQYFPFENAIGNQELELRNACLLHERELDGKGAGAVIGAVIGGTVGLIADVFTLGGSVGAGTVVGVTAGSTLGSYIDGREVVLSICETAELRVGYSTSDSSVQGLGRLYYKKKPLTTYLDGHVERFSKPPKPFAPNSTSLTGELPEVEMYEVMVYPYHFVCKKKACLKFGTKKVADRYKWINAAVKEINAVKRSLRSRLKILFTLASESMKYFYRASLSLDTMARTGYGHALENQPQLREYLDTLTLFLINLDSTELKTDRVLLGFESIYSSVIKADETTYDLLVEPIAAEPMGWGLPWQRHKALEVLSNRNYLTHQVCRWRN